MNNFLQPTEIDAFVPIEKKEYEEMEEVSLNDLVRAFSGIQSPQNNNADND